MTEEYLNFGNEDHKEEEYNKKWEKLGDYAEVKKLNDPRFGDITVLKHKISGEIIFSQENNPINQKKLASDQLHQLKGKMKSVHPSLLHLLGYSMETRKGLCATNYVATSYYPYPKTDLFKEQNSRLKENKVFSTNQLNDISTQTLKGVENLHRRGQVHGDIRPQNIGFNADKNECILLDYLKDPSSVEKKQINNITSDDRELFMSPQLYAKIDGSNKDQTYSEKKNDLFALGMTLLKLGNNKSVQNCYKPKGEFSQDALKAHLNEFKSKNVSNQNLNNLVENLVENDEQKRLSSTELLNNFVNKKIIANVNQTPSTNYVFNQQPKVTYVQSTPNYVNYNYVQEPIKTTYVQAEPTYTYVQEPIKTTYVQAEPTYTYVQEPIKTTYVQAEPIKTTQYRSMIFVDANKKDFLNTAPAPNDNYTEVKKYTLVGDKIVQVDEEKKDENSESK
jgi:serine/threonine protein kinase